MAKGRSNTEAYENYKESVCGDQSADDGLKENLPAPADPDFLNTAVGFWIARYTRRQEAIHHTAWDADVEPLADTTARDILVARTRARNSKYAKSKDFSAAQVAFNSRVFANSGLDVACILDIPSYGPSFLSLWAEATRQGLSGKDALEFISQWGSHIPAAWEQEDSHGTRKPPKVKPKVKARLAQVVTWRKTQDRSIPWDAEVDGHHWQVRLNDFPDEPMYTLLIDGAVIGDYQEWPQAWDRSEEKPKAKKAKTEPAALVKRAILNIDAATLLDRYQNGEFEAVWRDLVALGPDVRKEPYQEASWAVAKETMRRANHNVKVLVKRLKELDYRFHSPYAMVPSTKEELKILSRAERKGLLIPLSMRAFLEGVGTVSLVGVHPALGPVERLPRSHPREKPRFKPEFLTDALAFVGSLFIESILENWEDVSPEDREPVSWMLSPDAEGKAGMLSDTEPDGYYEVQLPNAAADAVLQGEAHKLTLVEYLRLSFQWGGFPGWKKYKKRPEKELAFLKEGLLPL